MLPRVSWKRFFTASGLIGCIVLTASAGFALSYLLDQSLVIKQVTVSADNSDVAIFGLHQFTGQSMLTTPASSIEDTILTTNPHLQNVNVTKTYPDQIHLRVVERPVAAAVVSSEGWILLAQDGTILQKLRSDDQPSSPVIQYYQTIPHHQLQAGDQLDHSDITIALSGMEMLSELGLRTDTVVIDSFDRVALTTTDDSTVIFSTEKPLDDQKHHLESLIGGLRKEDSDFYSIDLRFDRPVLVPNP